MREQLLRALNAQRYQSPIVHGSVEQFIEMLAEQEPVETTTVITIEAPVWPDNQ